jgi:hypothetical protein
MFDAFRHGRSWREGFYVAKVKVNEDQLEALSMLYRRVAACADSLGSENTDSGQVIPTTLKTFRGARLAHFPADYVFTRLTRSAFEKAFGEVNGVGALLATLASLDLQVGFVSAPGRFDPAAHSRGVFWICLFAHGQERYGRNVLIRFLRVET